MVFFNINNMYINAVQTALLMFFDADQRTASKWILLNLKTLAAEEIKTASGTQLAFYAQFKL